MANLQDHVRELEAELSSEKNRGKVSPPSPSPCLPLLPVASGEIQDMSETYQTNMVKLNQQLTDLSLQLSQAKKAKAEAVQALRADLEAAMAGQREEAERVEHLEAALREAKEAKQALSDQEEEERGSMLRKASMVELRLEEMCVERDQWEAERTELTSQLQAAERELNRFRERLMEVEAQQGSPQQQSTESQPSPSASSRVARLEGELEAARSDYEAESEILQARISELTRDKSNAESLYQQLQSRMDELKEGLEARSVQCLAIYEASGNKV